MPKSRYIPKCVREGCKYDPETMQGLVAVEVINNA
jgi:hypothetical protein